MDLVVTVGGNTFLVDVAFTDFRTTDIDQLASRLRKDGAAARRAEDRKRQRYQVQTLVPIAVETGGRIGEAGLRWLRQAYHRAGAQAAEWRGLLRELSGG